MSKKAHLTGKTAVVTGAGSGIGRATALLLARRGAKVHIADMNKRAADTVTEEIRAAGGNAVAHALDVTDPYAVEALAEEIFATDGGVDILHNNAGIGHGGNIEATTIDDWQKVIGVNLLGVAYCVQAFVPRMLKQGRPASVINTASQLGLMPASPMAPYCASKYGVVGLSEALNAELSGRGIHVSAICPGMINTPIIHSTIVRGNTEKLHAQIAKTYANRGTSPGAVAKAVLKAVDKRRMIVTVPTAQVLPAVLIHRLSPLLTQPVARYIEKFISRG
jgi:NAD(P)-dependent dehydrogenase (short-subunit alcohol dehydrogenase family)